MVDLVPAPAALGLSSPALGAWFAADDGSDLTALPPPDGDLACLRAFPVDAVWTAPASGTLSYLIATPQRPPALAGLRGADGAPAFADGAFVLLFTLLPEVAHRLGALSQAVPRPDSTDPAGTATTRPVITRFALELPVGAVTSVADLAGILPAKDAADIRALFDDRPDDAAKRAYLGFAADQTTLTNGEQPVTILRRPEKDGVQLFKNQTGSPLNTGRLWSFDQRGRAFDAGAVAAIWTRLAGTDWDNLWASDDAARQRTCAVDAARTVHLVNAHEGPLEPAIAARIAGNLTDLTAVGSSSVVLRAGAAPAIGVSAAPVADEDTAPLPRIAPLPAGPYRAPDDAQPFAGWADAGALTRDFCRVALTDIERQVTGLARSAGSAQADPRRRVTAARNTAMPVVLPTIDAVAAAATAQFAQAGSTVSFIAPELDAQWGPQPATPLGDTDVFHADWTDIGFAAHALKGSGSVDGGSAAGQSIVLHFDGSLPPDAWLRVWPHGRDTTTGRRFRMTGGAALADAGGAALVIVPLPNGQNGDGAVEFSFDFSLTSTVGSRYYPDNFAIRPAVDTSAAPVDPAALAAGQGIYCPETAAVVMLGAGQVASGHSLLAFAGAVGDGDYTAVDTAALQAVDLAAVVANSADAGDTLVTHDPAFVQTTAGDIDAGDTAATLRRNPDFYKAAQGQEIHDFALHDATNNTALIGGIAARALWHEAPPVSVGHPGVNAAPEIHGAGIALAGPAADLAGQAMRERLPEDLLAFITSMGRPVTPAPAAATAEGVWTAVLETAAPGTHGHGLMGLIPASVQPGLAWDNSDPANQGIKQQIDAVLGGLPGGLTTDGLIDSASFDDDTAAATFDRVLDKHRGGMQGFARAALAAIGRAEDLIWLQTPALDGESWSGAGGDIALLEAITTRLADNQALHCLFVLPQKHLPDRNAKLDAVRVGAIQGALATLQAAAPDRIAWVTPTAGASRATHMAATTLIVDDAVLMTGAAHGWRRGLTFDSALTASVFDDDLTNGRPRSVAEARRLYAATMLGVGVAFVPDTAGGLIRAARAQNAGGGFGRVKPAAYVAAADPTTGPDKEIWNPATSSGIDWLAMIAALTGDAATSFQDGTR